MTDTHIARLVAALLAVVTPWIVVRIVFGVAARHARSVRISLARPRVTTALDRLTMAAIVAVVAAFASAVPPLWTVTLEVVVLAVLAAVGHIEARRRARIRQVFALQAVLGLTCLAVAHAALDLDWDLHAAWGAVLSLVGSAAAIVGCVLALAPDLSRRRYRMA